MAYVNPFEDFKYPAPPAGPLAGVTGVKPGPDQPPGPPPNAEPPGVPGPSAPPAPTGGGCPEGTPAGPASCCPPTKVWRPDTKKCEEPDARSKEGKETCTGTRPEGCLAQCVWCDFDTGEFRCDWNCSRTGGYATGGGAGGGGGKASSGAGGAYSTLEKMLQDALEGMLKGQPSRYNPQTMQMLYGGLRSQSESNIARQQAAVKANAAQRGMSRAGQTQAQLADVRRGVEAGELQNQISIQKSKIDADYQDKVAALDRAQRFLDSARDFAYKMKMSAQQQAQFNANLALAYAQLQQQWDMLVFQQGMGGVYGSV